MTGVSLPGLCVCDTLADLLFSPSQSQLLHPTPQRYLLFLRLLPGPTVRHLLAGLADRVESEGLFGLPLSVAGSTVSTLSRALSSSEFGSVGEDGCGSPPIGAVSSGGCPPVENDKGGRGGVEVVGLEQLLRVPDPGSLTRDPRERGRGSVDESCSDEDSFRDAQWRLGSDDSELQLREEVWFDAVDSEEVWFDPVDSPIPSGYEPYDDDGGALRGAGSWSESLEGVPWGDPTGDGNDRGLSAQHEEEERDDIDDEEEEDACWIDLPCEAERGPSIRHEEKNDDDIEDEGEEDACWIELDPADDGAERGPSALHEEGNDDEEEVEEEAYWIDPRCLRGGSRGENSPQSGRRYALDDSCPSFRSVLDAAASLALDVLGADSVEWRPDGDTARALAASDRGDDDCTNRHAERDVLKWTGTHGGCPILKTRGVVDMSPRALLSVLLDPDRAPEYNRNCTGKVRLRTFDLKAETNDDEDGVFSTASIIRTSIRVPIVGTGIDTTCLVHSRPVEEGPDGCRSYVLVSVAVAHGPAGSEGDGGGGLVSASVLRPLSPAVPRDGGPSCAPDDAAMRCELTNVARAALPIPVPGFLLRRAAEAGADGFFEGVRDLAARERLGSV